MTRQEAGTRTADADASRVLTTILLSLFLCFAIILWQQNLRQGIFDPQSVAAFPSLFLFDDYTAALWMAALLVAVWPRPIGNAGLRLADWIGGHPLVTASATATVLAVAAWTVYHSHPLSMDEYAAVFQSRVFASGHIVGRMPVELLDWAVPVGFQGQFFLLSHTTGEVVSAYWPGFALYLTPFTFAGVPWLANPILGGLTVLAAHRCGMRFFNSERSAGLIALLTVASPAVTVNAISFYSMSAHLLLNIVYVLLILRGGRTRYLLAGLIGGVALVLHNPVPHLLFAMPWCIWILVQKDRWTRVAWLLAGYLPIALCLGAGWWWMSHQVADHVSGSLPAGVGILDLLDGMFRTPTWALFEARLIGLAKLLLWAVPALPVVAAFSIKPSLADSRVRVLFFSFVVTFVGYLFVPFDQGHGWGFRYLHSAWIALPVLAASGLTSDRALSQQGILRYLCGSALVSLVLMTGLRFFQVDQFISRQLAQVPESPAGSARVVFVSTAMAYYGGDLVQNDPFLRGRLVFLSRGRKADAQFMATQFSDLELLSRSYRGSVWGTREGD